jgi:dimethylargininase
VTRTPIDHARAVEQHRDYERALRRLGCTVAHLPATPDLPDSVFVEDTAIVLDEIAVVTRPGAPSRQPETPSVATALARYRRVHSLTAPATMDGGDVLRVGRRLYVAISSRSNDDGVRQLSKMVNPFGYTVESVRVRGCLHLKSAVTAIDREVLLCNPDWVDAEQFDRAAVIGIDPDEPFAANVLRVAGVLLCGAAHPRTAADLRRRGYEVHLVDVSELAKAEAGVTCCSLIFERASGV